MTSKRPSSSPTKQDARGQFARSQANSTNNGMASAEPRVLSKEGQAPVVDEQKAFGRDINDRKSNVRNKIGTGE